jgi:hypothetical protein
MIQSNLQSLGKLDDAVLREVVREAERRLDAQLATANAADQRAMSWAAILVTGAVALVGASAALLVAGKSLALATVGLVVSGLLGVALLKAIDVFRPKEWHFPGNEPVNWLPENWQCHGSGAACDLRQAMLEQAASLDTQIRGNAHQAKVAGDQLKLSMDFALYAVVVGIVSVALLTLAQAAGLHATDAVQTSAPASDGG